VGGLKNINLELVFSLKPDLVLCTEDGNDLTQLKKLKELGLELDCFQPANLEEVLETILQIGELLSCPEKAKELIQELKAKRAYPAIKGKTGGSRKADKKNQTCSGAGGLSAFSFNLRRSRHLCQRPGEKSWRNKPGR